MEGPRTRLDAFRKRIDFFQSEQPKTGQILCYGSSIFTRWTGAYDRVPLEDVIRMKDGSQAIVNHGIGGSTSDQLLYYYPEAVRPWRPRALVLQAGLNDLAKGYTPVEILMLQSRILEYAREDFPGIRLFLCNLRPVVKPESKNSTLWISHALELDERLREYASRHADVVLVNHLSFAPFYEEGGLGDYQKAREKLFIEDGVHLTQEGYDLYKAFLSGYLKDLL